MYYQSDSVCLFQIVFEGVVGSSYAGDVAIDDISFTNFRCTHIPSNAAPPTVAPTTTVPSDSNCTFETGLCNWRQITTDDFQWTRNKDNTGSFGTGPLGDHTTGKGNYQLVSNLIGNCNTVRLSCRTKYMKLGVFLFTLATHPCILFVFPSCCFLPS